ncbi:LamG-like jellyroll fold domain-containing protein [Spartinivicinus poritis]|uniref:LamG-like jellyroll fold domain-containing protein n=1 Tax=Spartinivicinus poritis TaxID=2994640 RepID=A0ABT5UAP5_9GAMM|nr:LamG-like jellyroll fold domain-containing protein [Spartinivicinus sp. A2-2]MDE1463460.1 hypothetical protein [Spartinivicinus sp. A2-2]
MAKLLHIDFATAEGGQVQDISGNNRHATVAQGEPAVVTDSYLGQVLYFSGNDYLSVPAFLTNHQNFTISVWAKPTLINNKYHAIFGRQIEPSQNTITSLDRFPSLWVGPGGYLHYDIYDHHNNDVQTPGARVVHNAYDMFTEESQWVHITWVKEGTNSRIYRNGILFKESTAPAQCYFKEDVDYHIGHIDNYFVGCLAHLRVYDEVQTNQAIIADLLSDRGTYQPSNKVLHLNFAKIHNQTVPDMSDSLHHGQFDATTAPTVCTTDDLFPKVIKTSDGHFSCPSPFTNNHSFTLSLWVKPQTNSGQFGLLGHRDNGPNGETTTLGLEIANNQLRYILYENNNGNLGSLVTGLFASNYFQQHQWTHITWVKEGNSCRLYKNGVLTDEGQAPSDFYLAANSTLLVGKLANRFDGSIYNVRVYDRPLLIEQIQRDMHEDSPPEVLKQFTAQYSHRDFIYTDMVNHQGNLVAFAMDSERKIYYAVLNPNNAESNSPTDSGELEVSQTSANNKALDVNYWPATPSLLPFPAEITEVGFLAGNNFTMTKVTTSQLVAHETHGLSGEEQQALASWKSSTGALTAQAPFKALSDGKHIFIFRQALHGTDTNVPSRNNRAVVDSTLLADRFVMVGSQLNLKRETRYQHSRKKLIPDNSKDARDTVDLEGKVFYEPTQELSFINNLSFGAFSVNQVPTAIADIKRWQFFAYNNSSRLIDSYSIEVAKEGLFNFLGTQFYTSPDPELRKSVFESKPGKDTKGNDLVPVKTNDGFASYGLIFNDQASLQINTNAFSHIKNGSVTFWLRRNNTPLNQNAVLFSNGSQVTVTLSQTGHLTVLIGTQELTVGDVLTTANQWHHLAIVKEANKVMIYQDGIIKGQSLAMPETFSDSASTQLQLAEHFIGELDEVQIWSRALSAREVSENRRYRLLGNETNLIAYYRLDEGQGQYLLDYSRNSLHGTLQLSSGSTNDLWTNSSAPIGEQAGINRFSFSVNYSANQNNGKLRRVEGLDAALYYQQENAATGYDAASKPMKTLPRVLLTVSTATTPANSQVVENRQVDTLDFGISRHGKLALAPTQLVLPEVQSNSAEVNIPNLLIEREAKDALAKQKVTAIETLQAQVTQHNNTLSQLNEQKLSIPDKQTELSLATTKRNELAQPFTITLYTEYDQQGSSYTITENEYTSGSVEIQTWSNRIGVADLSDLSGFNNNVKSFGLRHTHYHDIYAYNSPNYSNQHCACYEVPLYFFSSVVNDGIGLNVKQNPEPSISSFIVYTDLIQYHRNQAEVKVQNLTNEIESLNATIDSDIATEQAALNNTQSQLNTAIDELQQLRNEIDVINDKIQGEKSIVMPLLHSDANGLTISGATLTQADAKGNPRLVDSVVGNVNLYYTDQQGSLFTSHLNTLTERVSYNLSTEGSSSVKLIAQHAGQELAQTVISITDGSVADRCNLSLVNSNFNLRETWSDVPRDPQLLARILNGQARKINANTPVGTINDEYNYASVMTENEKPGVKNGSRLFFLNPGSHTQKLINANITSNSTVIKPVQWRTQGQGTALYFDGQQTQLTFADGVSDHLLHSDKDLSIEAWIKPERSNSIRDRLCLIYYRTDADHLFSVFLDYYDQDNATDFRIRAEVQDKHVRSNTRYDFNQWYHLSLVYKQSTAIKFGEQNRGLRVPHASTLDMIRDCTIECFVQRTSTNQTQALVNKGSNFGLFLHNGKVAYRFADEDDNVYYVETNAILSADDFHKITVTRAFVSEDTSSNNNASVSVTNTGGNNYSISNVSNILDDIGSLQTKWVEVRIYVDGQAKTLSTSNSRNVQYNRPAGSQSAPANTIAYVHYSDNREVNVRTSSTDVTFGVAHFESADASVSSSNQGNFGYSNLTRFKGQLEGTVAEIRLWSSALEASQAGREVQNLGNNGLIAHWKFEEGDGSIAEDSVSNNHARPDNNSVVKWVRSPDSDASYIKLYVNGDEVTDVTEEASSQIHNGFYIGRRTDDHGAEDIHYYKGVLDELRLWKTARTEEEIQDNMFRRLLGERDDLLAYYTFDLETANTITDQSGRNVNLALSSGDAAYHWQASKAPVSIDAPLFRNTLADVTTPFQTDASSTPAVAEYSDIQFDSNNELQAVFKRAYSVIKDGAWRIFTGFKVGNLITEWVSQVQTNPQVIGFIEGAPPVPGENLTGHSNGRFPYTGASKVEFKQADSVNYSYATGSKDDWFFNTNFYGGLTTSFEAKGLFAPLGFGTELTVGKFESKIHVNFGVDFNGARTEEISYSSTEHKGKSTVLELGGTVEQNSSDGSTYTLPEKRFVPDNIGMALVRSQTADVYALRLAHNGVLVAYRTVLNADIPEDYNVITFPINPRYTKQGTLDGKLGYKFENNQYVVNTDEHYTESTHYGEYSYYKPKEAYALKQRIELEEDERRVDYQDFGLESGYIGQNAPDLPTPYRKNLVNTYVWTAAGGFFTESSSVMDAVSEKFSGSNTIAISGGIKAEFTPLLAGVGFTFGVSAQAGGSFTTTAHKSKNASSGFSVDVSTGGVSGNLQLYAGNSAEASHHGVNVSEGVFNNGEAVARPGKVDAYRFNSYFLQGSTENFEHFANKVVDANWLAESNDANAVALRQAIAADQAANDTDKAAPWRIMHRVTFVSRILPEVEANPQTNSLPQALSAARINSNYALIKRLEPYVKPATQLDYQYGNFANKVRMAITNYLPEVQDASDDIVKLLSQYYEVFPE